jgi:hypothetical protein
MMIGRIIHMIIRYWIFPMEFLGAGLNVYVSVPDGV